MSFAVAMMDANGGCQSQYPDSHFCYGALRHDGQVQIRRHGSMAFRSLSACGKVHYQIATIVLQEKQRPLPPPR